MRLPIPLLTATLLALSISSARAVEIVKDGQPVATIVIKAPPPAATVADAPTKKDRKKRRQAAPDTWDDTVAAKVLAEWIKKMTGAELPIASTPAPGMAGLYVGQAALDAGLNLNDIKSESHEGVRIVADEKRVLLAGQNDMATVKAACRFLEALGCRYFMDGPLGETFPHTKNLSADKLNITEQPGFVSRRIWGSGWSRPTLWKVWNGDGGISMAAGHAWPDYVDEEWAQKHPDWFAMYNGNRVPYNTSPEGKKTINPWVNTANPELRAAFAQKVKQAIAGGATNPSISPPDGVGYDQSPESRAQDDPQNIEPSSGKISVTNRYLDFFNSIARSVKPDYPQSLLGFYVYADYTQPPTHGMKAEPNLVPWIAPLRYCRVHHTGDPKCPGRFQLLDVINKWSQASSQLALRCYNFNAAEVTVPFSMLTTWKLDMPYYKSKKFIAINNETLPAWNIYGPHIYLSARLAYDPEADADQIMDDYFQKFYGPKAGPLIKQYWMAVDQGFQNLDSHSGSYYSIHRVYTKEFLARCADLMRQAGDAAKTGEPEYAARVAMEADGFQNAVQYTQLRGEINSGEFVAAQKTLDAFVARVGESVKAGYGSAYTATYLKRFLGKPITAGLAATENGQKSLQVLPDEWRFRYDEAAPDAPASGEMAGFFKPDFDDSGWQKVRTYSDTLDAQGVPEKQTNMWYRTTFKLPENAKASSLFFAEIDGTATVYLNGQKVIENAKRRAPFAVDVANFVRPGVNSLVVKANHTEISELDLGGIIRPAYLIWQ